jgi:hypothetical protein
MNFLQGVYYNIWSNFHVDNLSWIEIEFELKFNYRSELNLN